MVTILSDATRPGTDKPGMLPVPDALDLAPPDVAKVYEEYKTTRDKQFQNWYALQNVYFTLDKGQRKAFLNQFPELKKYWDWRRQFIKDNPEIEQYVTSSSTTSSTSRTVVEAAREVLIVVDRPRSGD